MKGTHSKAISPYGGLGYRLTTFTGERCLYNALNDRIRNLLLAYDYSKSTDPLQPLASHVTSLLTREQPNTSDIVVISAEKSFNLHKFILASRSPYFCKKLGTTPETSLWKLPATVPPQAFEIAIKYIYLGELPNDVGGGAGTGYSEEEVLEGIDKISKQLEVRSLWDGILEIHDRRLARQYKTEEAQRGRSALETWFRDNVIKHKVVLESSKAHDVKWDRENGIFADVLLRADDLPSYESPLPSGTQTPLAIGGIPIGPLATHSAQDPSPFRTMSTLFPAHKAMLLRSEYFHAMFSSTFREAQESPHLQIITVDCTPDVLEAVLAFLYAERAEFPLDIAVDVLFAADLLLIEQLKAKAALIISTLGNGTLPAQNTQSERPDTTQSTKDEGESASSDPLDPFTILRAAWLLRVPRLEHFAARYLAYRLENYIDLPELSELITESAARIKNRQETDSIELVDDIRYYLSERFRLRFEGEGIEEMLGEEALNQGRKPVENGIKIEDNEDALHINGTTEKHAEAELAKGTNPFLRGEIRTLDGEIAGDEFARDAIDYQVLLGKIEVLLDQLDLDG